MKGLASYRVITEGVVSVAGEGAEAPAPAAAVRAVQHRSDHSIQAWMVLCTLCTAKSRLSAAVLWKAQTKDVSARFTVQEAVTTALLRNETIGAEQRPENAGSKEQVSAVRLHTSRERQAEPGDVILLSKSSQKLLTQIPCVTLLSTPQGTKSLLHYSAESPMAAGVVFSAHRQAGGSWNGMGICSVISSLVFPPFVF